MTATEGLLKEQVEAPHKFVYVQAGPRTHPDRLFYVYSSQRKAGVKIHMPHHDNTTAQSTRQPVQDPGLNTRYIPAGRRESECASVCMMCLSVVTLLTRRYHSVCPIECCCGNMFSHRLGNIRKCLHCSVCGEHQTPAAPDGRVRHPAQDRQCVLPM